MYQSGTPTTRIAVTPVTLSKSQKRSAASTNAREARDPKKQTSTITP